MSGFSALYENKILDLFFNRIGFPTPKLYLGLGQLITDADTGETFNETVGGGYSRIATPASYWSIAADGYVRNIVEITWIFAATGDWTPVTHYAFLNTSVIGEGDIICYGILPNPLYINEFEILSFETGDIEIYLD